MYRVWAATLIATTYLHIATATNGITELDSSLNSRGFRGIPRPGRVADDFPPVPGPVPGPIPRLGDRPKTSPGDDLNLPKRPLPGSGSDGPDAPNSGGNDPYVPPKVPDLSGSTLPSKVENKGLGGEASGTYHPCSPSRYDEKLCLELIGVGIDLLQELLPDPEESSTSTVTRNLEATSGTATTVPTAFRDLAIETSVPAMPMPNLNMSEWMSGTKYTKLYTSEEFDLLRDDPLCFFAVYERIYRAYASLGLSTATGSASGPAPTSDDLSRRQISCHNAPELCKEPAEKAKTLYLGYLPDQIHLVYKYTPTEVTVKETGTTSCGGFTMEDQVTIPAFETTYGVFEYRPGQSPEPEPTESPPGQDDNVVEDDAARVRSLSIVVVGCSAIAALAGILL